MYLLLYYGNKVFLEKNNLQIDRDDGDSIVNETNFSPTYVIKIGLWRNRVNSREARVILLWIRWAFLRKVLTYVGFTTPDPTRHFTQFHKVPWLDLHRTGQVGLRYQLVQIWGDRLTGVDFVGSRYTQITQCHCCPVAVNTSAGAVMESLFLRVLYNNQFIVPDKRNNDVIQIDNYIDAWKSQTLASPAAPLAVCVQRHPCTYRTLTPSTECHRKSVLSRGINKT